MGEFVTGRVNSRRRAPQSAFAAALVVGVLGAAAGCTSASEGAVPTTTALIITVSPSVIAPSGLPSSATVEVSSAAVTPSSESALAASTSVPSSTSESAGPAASGEAPSAESVELNTPTPIATSEVVLRDTPSPEEAANRAAIEAQWVKFWEVAAGLSEQPEDQWDALISEVSIDPMRSSVLESASRRKLANRSNYGSIGHFIFWQFPVDGADVATIADCQDHSKAGMIDNTTGERSDPGGARVNVRGILARGQDGVWRVREYFELADSPCPNL